MTSFTFLRVFSCAALAGATLLLAGCNKDQITPDSTISAEDQGRADDENAALSDLVEAAAPADPTQVNGTVAEAADLDQVLGKCATRTYDAATRTLTIDFGPVNCIGPNGVARRGKIVAVFSGPYRAAGAVATITPQNYFVNDNQHTGPRIITSLGQGSFTLSVPAASVITSSGTHSWSSARTYTRTAGFGTRTILDDKYQVTGQASGTNRRGVSYEAIIGEPLVKVFTVGCARHFLAGTVTITNSKDKTLLLNYDPTGTAACDNIAAVTINGRTRTIRLR